MMLRVENIWRKNWGEEQEFSFKICFKNLKNASSQNITTDVPFSPRKEGMQALCQHSLSLQERNNVNVVPSLKEPTIY